MKKTLYCCLLLAMGTLRLFAQETFPVNGVKDERAGAYAFTHATLMSDYQTKIEDATLLIRDGKVENAGKGLAIPRGYVEIDLKGKYVYPGLVDMYSTYGQGDMQRPAGGRGFGGPEQIDPANAGPYNANDAIKSHFNSYEVFKPDAREAADWRRMGFGALLTFRPDGVARGSSAVVTLGDDRSNEVMLNSRASAQYSFNKGSSTQNYPVSQMGYISLLRQTFLDAQWYAQHKEKPFTDKALDAWLDLKPLPQVFEANSWLALLQADRVGDEFGVQYIIKSGGDEYKRIDLVKASKAPLIVPVNFPEPFDVEDPLDAYRISLEDLKHWELAPANLATLEKNGIDFAITAYGLRDKKQFLANLRKAMQHGLSEQGALRALTATPARLLGMEALLGNLKKGAVANFVISSGPLFDEETTIYENWIQGRKYQIEDMAPADYRGKYQLTANGQNHNLEITGKPGKQSARIVVNDSTEIKVSMKTDGEVLTLSFNPDPKDKKPGGLTLSGYANNRNLKGRGQLPNGSWINWSATYQGEPEEKKKGEGPGGRKDNPAADLGPVIYPFGAYGTPEVQKPEDMLIRNATVWTMEKEGKMDNSDVLIRSGKIAQIGKNLKADGVKVVDGTGKHLTPGIIDEHSHIAAQSINEILTNSSLVRIGDNINPEDLEIYRALAGGVTAVQVLHGSANPIGGQSGLIKLRWGQGPEQLKIEGADGFIKFALGENVKRSSSQQSIRYPQTRMGVEQVYVDAFSNALEYEKQWQAYDKLPAAEKAKAMKPRRDLTSETMLEIIRGKRFITCHSYVQSEINMLMKVAEQFGFRVNTFTHILEGYKVADKMAAHGVGASTFSDWWNYKWEVRYAIPYNPAIMHREGIVTAINSDDAEMMRRLNQEAAKSVKYGGLSEDEALAMVTINPAKLLHLDKRMGSLKAGKDADVVLWSDNPLSIYARPEKTIVDGTVFYDAERDQQLKTGIDAERARLIAKMRAAKAGGAPTQAPRARVSLDFHCDDVIYSNE